MQYIVNEVSNQPSNQASDAKIFNSVQDALQFILKKNKNKKLFLGDQEVLPDRLIELLKERLSTVTLVVEKEPGKRFTITAFEKV